MKKNRKKKIKDRYSGDDDQSLHQFEEEKSIGLGMLDALIGLLDVVLNILDIFV